LEQELLEVILKVLKDHLLYFHQSLQQEVEVEEDMMDQEEDLEVQEVQVEEDLMEIQVEQEILRQ
jgi:hypothetical protein